METILINNDVLPGPYMESTVNKFAKMYNVNWKIQTDGSLELLPRILDSAPKSAKLILRTSLKSVSHVIPSEVLELCNNNLCLISLAYQMY